MNYSVLFKKNGSVRLEHRTSEGIEYMSFDGVAQLVNFADENGLEIPISNCHHECD